MSYELLGPSFDIHGGGLDLQFPHHENEIAQSCCAHPEASFAQVWMHNEMLQVEGKKMSKSLGNFFTVRDLLDQGVPGEVIRFVYLSTHYRKPMDWTAEKAREAEATLRKWRGMTNGVAAGKVSAAVLGALSDDLNTSGVLAALHELAAAEDTSTLKASAQLLGLLHDQVGGWFHLDDPSISTAKALRELAEQMRVSTDVFRDFSEKFAEIAGAQSKVMSKLRDQFTLTLPSFPSLKINFPKIDIPGSDPASKEASERLAEKFRSLTEPLERLGRELASIERDILDTAWGEMPVNLPVLRRAEALKVAEKIRARSMAKSRRDFVLADQIRDELKIEGIELVDGKDGTKWKTAV